MAVFISCLSSLLQLSMPEDREKPFIVTIHLAVSIVVQFCYLAVQNWSTEGHMLESAGQIVKWHENHVLVDYVR